jgi:hypothetical protein
MRTMTDFCPHCDVTMDLHPDIDDADEWGCEVAQKKAELLESFPGRRLL